MAFGALLTDEQGVPFYIDGTRPLTLINKITYTVPAEGGLRSVDLYANDGTLRFAFLQSNGSFTGLGCSWLQLVNNVWRLNVAESPGATVTVFVFGYANQPVPSWGMAIWDASGNCILTNESKVLRDIQTLGDQSNDTTSGYRYSGTLNGSWAVAPYWSGIFTGVDNSSGQARPVRADFYLSARYNGSQTMLTSGRNGSIDGNISNPTYTNSRCLLTAINVARY